ncbi:putative nucleotidyltransferase with HDIG domain [Fontibacillus solani]|uniref:Putative nucleotidyltransferase with HDIG domain n=1 Tax=Fontibacillus solani TaxID=1572857 RepID=A0A7W3SX46_9BACL|nr:HD domain-containing phosphohydrolase [Fontibacillus solani]MBA9087851.1 putative nucleotidyltransferase with HDIG domain [Fontibacillus solani]
MRTHIMDLKEGDRLKSDIFNRAGLHVLPRGTSIHKEEIALLIRQSINHVDIETREELVPVAGSTRQDFSQLLQENFEIAVKGFQSVFLEALTTGKFSQSMVEDKLQPMLEVIDQKKDVVSLLITFGQEDVNIYNHSLQVGLLSYYIASWLGYSKKECEEISKAGYLHDIGKSQVSQSIRNHEESLNEEEREEMKRHTTYGYDIIRESMTSEKIALAALQHHEREDGSGYPNELKKDDIHPYAQIVAVANTYVGLTAPKEGSPKPGLLTVLRKVYELGFGELNEKAVQALTRNLLPNFIGKRARLSSGETATIIWNNPSDYFKPLVQVGEQFRDLSVERNIVVEELFME